MDSENCNTNFQAAGLELQKKRKRRRGKQTRKFRDVENASSESIVNETDVQDNEDMEEDTILCINNCTLDDDQSHINNHRENTNYLGITTDAFVSQSSVENETEQYPISASNNGYPPEFEDIGRRNLVSDNGVNIFTDGLSSSCIKNSESSPSVAKTEVYEPVELGSDDVAKLYRASSTVTQEEQVLYNSKALIKSATTYQLENFAKNVLIIFNQKNFDAAEQRKGTDKDVESLMDTFKPLDFSVLPYTDRTKNQIMEILEAISKQDFTDYGCVGIVVLTHGYYNGELLAYDGKYSEMDIINSLKTHKNPSMITKPRLLIIQACRGKNAIAGMPVLRRGKIRTDLNYETEPYTLPVEADMLVLHSSYPGNPAHRHELEGTWFIQTLCEKIKDLAQTHDLESILTEVKHKIAVDKEHVVPSRSGGVDDNKQIPVVTSTLIRKLYLRKYGDAGENAASNMKERCTNTSVDTTNVETSLEKCSCTLEYFVYIKRCLMHYVEGNPEDASARTLLELTETFNSEAVFNSAKEKCAVAISHHLYHNAKNAAYYKYLHIYKI